MRNGQLTFAKPPVALTAIFIKREGEMGQRNYSKERGQEQGIVPA